MSYGIGFGSAGAAGSSKPVPLTIPNLTAWWDGSRNRYSDLAGTVPSAYGSPVRTWVTRDGSNLAASTSSDGNDILGMGGGIDGGSGPGLYGTVAGQILTSTLNVTRPYTLIVKATPGATAGVDRFRYLGTTTSIYTFITTETDAPGIACLFNQAVINQTIAPPSLFPHTFIFRCDNSGSSCWVDGVNQTTTGTYTLDWGTLVFGGQAGTLEDILAFSRILSDSEATALTNYLNAPLLNLIADGNSITYGFTDTIEQAWPVVMANSMAAGNPSIRIANVAVTESTTRDRNTAAPTVVDTRFDSLAGRNVVILWEATNDMFGISEGNETAAQAYTNYKTYSSGRVAANPTIKPVLVACMSRNAGAFDPQIEAFNSLNLADYTVATSSPYVWLPSGGVTAYGAKMWIDLFSVPQLRDSTNTAYFNGDQLHLNAAGEAVAAGIMQTALGLLP